MLRQTKFLKDFNFKKISRRTIILFFVIVLLFLSVFWIVSKYGYKKYKPIYPEAKYVSDEIIVKYRDGIMPQESKEIEQKLAKTGFISQKKIYDSNNPSLRNFYLLLNNKYH